MSLKKGDTIKVVNLDVDLSFKIPMILDIISHSSYDGNTYELYAFNDVKNRWCSSFYKNSEMYDNSVHCRMLFVEKCKDEV